jgi:hypothetical protein
MAVKIPEQVIFDHLMFEWLSLPKEGDRRGAVKAMHEHTVKVTGLDPILIGSLTMRAFKEAFDLVSTDVE